MNIIDLENKLTKIDSYFRSGASDLTEKERLLSRIVKLNEEVGELCEAVLCENDSNQRNKEKEIDLDSELADVLICTLLLSLNRKANIWEKVDKKLKKQFDRFNLS